MHTLSRSLTVAAVLAVGICSLTAASKVDPKIPSYTQVAGVAGNIKSVGSDTMNNMMTLWAESFQAMYPNVKIAIEGKGSGTAPPALIEGTSTFGPMSRPMKADEQAKFEEKFGYKATNMVTSIDMLAVFVHKDNPVKGLNLQQVDAIFSSTLKFGASAPITEWKQAGVDGLGAVQAYGRNTASGTYKTFAKKALNKGDFKDSVKAMPGSSAVVSAIGTDVNGVGYSGIGYITPNVKAVPIAKEGTDYVAVTADNVAKYPLARTLNCYVNHKPGSALPPLKKEFVKFIFSQEGQKIVEEDGYLPLSAAACAKQLKQLGL